MPDEKPPQPEQPKTVSLPAMTDRALLEDLYRSSAITARTVERLEGSVDALVVDGRDLHGRMNRFEGRLDRLKNPTIPPPRPLTSDRVREIGDDHLSKPDLELQAKQAEEIVRRAIADEERDRKIAETHALAANAATKADVQAIVDSTATKDQVKSLVDAAAKTIADSTATKEEVKTLVEAAAKTIAETTKEEVKVLVDEAAIAQTAAIVAGIKAFVSKPLVQKIGYAAGVLLLQALTLGTAYLAMKGH